MKKRLIDANEINLFFYEGCDRFTLKDLLESEPTVDAVEVVRCKDCKYCDTLMESGVKHRICFIHGIYHDFRVDDDDFCSFGEREERKCK